MSKNYRPFVFGGITLKRKECYEIVESHIAFFFEISLVGKGIKK